jgi:hypothetical protein
LFVGNTSAGCATREFLHGLVMIWFNKRKNPREFLVEQRIIRISPRVAI